MTLVTPTQRAAGLAERVLFKSLILLALAWPIGVVAMPEGYNLERFYDAATYYRAGQAYLAGINPYQDFNFRQWPLVAALCAPLTLLPQWAAHLAMSALSWLGALAGLAAAHRRLRRDGVRPPRLCVALIALGPPFLLLFTAGQMSGLCFAAYGAGLLLIERRPRLGGACFALIAAKPHLVPIALPALIAAGPAAIVPFALAALCWPVGSLLVGGPHGLADFATQLLRVRGTIVDIHGLTLATLLPLRGPALAAAQLVGLVALAAFLGGLALLRRRRGQPISRGAIDAAVAVVLATLPYNGLYDLSFLSPLMLRLGAVPDRPAAALLAAWWLLILLAGALTPYGGAGILAIIPPAAAILWLARERSSASAPWPVPTDGAGRRPATTLPGRLEASRVA